MACSLENFGRGPLSRLFFFFPLCLRGLLLSGMRNSEKKKNNSDVFGNQKLELDNNSKNGDGQYLDRVSCEGHGSLLWSLFTGKV